MILGHDIVGSGAQRVIVMNDWLCDTSTWDGARAYLDGERFTYAFADLRGYGRSRFAGQYTVVEGASDAIALADHLGWPRFAIVGHSMSTLIAVHVAQHHADRITHVVLITPPPPGGFGADDAQVATSQQLAYGDRAANLLPRFAGRLSPGWARFKAQRWSETSDPEAAAAYVAMYARDGIPDRTAKIAAPVLAITGELDFEPMRSAGARASLSPICERLEIAPLAECGHYPMQEMPPLLVAIVERQLAMQVE